MNYCLALKITLFRAWLFFISKLFFWYISEIEAYLRFITLWNSLLPHFFNFIIQSFGAKFLANDVSIQLAKYDLLKFLWKSFWNINWRQRGQQLWLFLRFVLWFRRKINIFLIRKIWLNAQVWLCWLVLPKIYYLFILPKLYHRIYWHEESLYKVASMHFVEKRSLALEQSVKWLLKIRVRQSSLFKLRRFSISRNRVRCS